MAFLLQKLRDTLFGKPVEEAPIIFEEPEVTLSPKINLEFQHLLFYWLLSQLIFILPYKLLVKLIIYVKYIQ